MENYAGSSTLLIFDVTSASFTAGISVRWHRGEFSDSRVRKGPGEGQFLSFLSSFSPPAPASATYSAVNCLERM